MISKTDIRNDDDVREMVHTFYENAQKDDRLGYIFNDYANVDWDVHLPKMVDFWSNLLFQTGRYKGKPFQLHLSLPIKKQDFYRWFEIFETTVDKRFEGECANRAKKIAARMASSFSVRLEMEGKFD